MALLSGNNVAVHAKSERDRLHQRGFGELQGKKLVLDAFEALYLAERNKIRVEDRAGKKVSQSALERALGKKKAFSQQYAVFSDLTQKGYCVRTGLKFGFDFRVYPRGKKVGGAHTAFVVEVAGERTRYSMAQLARMVRMAQTLKTELLLAVVDGEGHANYFSASRQRP